MKYIIPIDSSITEIWISFRIQYTQSSKYNNHIARDLYIGAGTTTEIGIRHYADSYYYNSGTFVCWDIAYTPSTRTIEALSSWIIAYDNNKQFSPDKILNVWYR